MGIYYRLETHSNKNGASNKPKSDHKIINRKMPTHLTEGPNPTIVWRGPHVKARDELKCRAPSIMQRSWDSQAAGTILLLHPLFFTVEENDKGPSQANH